MIRAPTTVRGFNVRLFVESRTAIASRTNMPPPHETCILVPPSARRRVPAEASSPTRAVFAGQSGSHYPRDGPWGPVTGIGPSAAPGAVHRAFRTAGAGGGIFLSFRG